MASVPWPPTARKNKKVRPARRNPHTFLFCLFCFGYLNSKQKLIFYQFVVNKTMETAIVLATFFVAAASMPAQNTAQTDCYEVLAFRECMKPCMRKLYATAWNCNAECSDKCEKKEEIELPPWDFHKNEEATTESLTPEPSTSEKCEYECEEEELDQYILLPEPSADSAPSELDVAPCDTNHDANGAGLI